MTIAAPRALLVCAPNWIGDAVMATPTLAALRAGFPDARITVLARAGVVDVLTGHPAIDEVMLDDRRGRHRGAAGRLRLASDLRGRGFDGVLLLPNSFASALVAALARVPARVGYRTDGRGALLTTALAPPRKPAPHMTAYYLGLLAPWALAGDPRAVTLAVTDAERDAASRRLAEWGIGREERVVAVNPGAAYGSAKRWPSDRFAAVSRRLVQDGAAVLVLGAASERGLADAVVAGLGR
ncbi:MAG TPA: lipopolysaccharide heptosyltransferase II, partial [Nitrospiria bacterium]|nr:lipopolysaccharide heptosyltransferase II [Nitrospiria bacterium]